MDRIYFAVTKGNATVYRSADGRYKRPGSDPCLGCVVDCYYPDASDRANRKWWAYDEHGNVIDGAETRAEAIDLVVLNAATAPGA